MREAIVVVFSPPDHDNYFFASSKTKGLAPTDVVGDGGMRSTDRTQIFDAHKLS